MTVYFESASDSDMDDLEEAMGRHYAATVGKPYPIPPDTVGPGRQPADATPYHTRYYHRFLRHASGGVIRLNDTAAGWVGQSVRLGSGELYTVTFTGGLKARGELSADSTAVLDGTVAPRETR